MIHSFKLTYIYLSPSSITLQGVWNQRLRWERRSTRTLGSGWGGGSPRTLGVREAQLTAREGKMGKRGEWEGDQRGGERRWGEQGKSESWSAGVMQVEGDETPGLRQPIQGLAEIIIITTHSY